MKSNAQSGYPQHRQVIGSVTYCNGLCYIHFLNLRYQTQQFRFAFAVHYIAEITSGQFAILYFQFIGIYIVNAVFLLEIMPEVSETT